MGIVWSKRMAQLLELNRGGRQRVTSSMQLYSVCDQQKQEMKHK